MRTLQVMLMALVLTGGMSAQLMAMPLQVVKDTGNTQSVAPYLKGVEVPTKQNVKLSIKQAIKSGALSNKQLVSAKPLMLPPKNNFTLGVVKKHRLTIPHFEGTPIYIIGNDSTSLRWLQSNKTYLKKIHAVGIIANAASISDIRQIEHSTGMFFTTSNINGLSKLIGTNHYPVLVYQHWVMQ